MKLIRYCYKVWSRYTQQIITSLNNKGFVFVFIIYLKRLESRQCVVMNTISIWKQLIYYFKRQIIVKRAHCYNQYMRQIRYTFKFVHSFKFRKNFNLLKSTCQFNESEYNNRLGSLSSVKQIILQFYFYFCNKQYWIMFYTKF